MDQLFAVAMSAKNNTSSMDIMGVVVDVYQLIIPHMFWLSQVQAGQYLTPNHNRGDTNYVTQNKHKKFLDKPNDKPRQ